MRIAGLVKNSFVDYPGLIAAVIFMPGCNYDCFYCHNRPLLGPAAPSVPEQEVLDFLTRRRGLLDGVVLTGGEPTLQPDLTAFAGRIAAMGYRVKLDTNGSHPDRLSSLLMRGIIDYVAMDYKAPFTRYRELCGPEADGDAVGESLRILRQSGVEFELRTTFIPQLTAAEIEQMVMDAAPIPRYALQAYRVPESYRPEDRFRVLCTPHNADELRQTLDRITPLVGQAILRD